MYNEDSFFTLSVPGQIGLFALSCTLTVITLLIVWRISKGRHWALRLSIGLLAFFSFEWLSPQLYYTYYIFLLEVPWQLVIHQPPTPFGLTKLLTFSEHSNLSYHSRGLLGWAIIFTALAAKKRNR